MNTIRKAKDSDLSGILTLYHQLLGEDTKITPQREAAFQKILHGDGQYLLVMEGDNMIIATVHLHILPNLSRNGASAAFIENVVVDENRRCQNLGEAMIRRAMEIAEEHRCYKVFLCTGSPSLHDEPEVIERRHRFYEKCGLKRGIKTALVKYFSRPE